jgi:hypothetical protein
MQQRYYDPRVARFWSVDPVTVSSAGGNFNRYWYGSDNPYRFTDPDGRIIKIVGSTEDPEFKNKVVAALDKIMATKTGAELVQKLQRSDHVFQIVPGVAGNGNATGVRKSDAQNAKTPGQGSGAQIIFDSDNTNASRDSSGSTQRPPFIGLAHELGHASLADVGRYNNDYGQIIENTTPPAEQENLPIENAIRHENGLPERSWYYDYEPN